MKDDQLSETVEDPIVMYIVVRESLGMGVGKTCAQVGHAVQMLTLKYFDMKEESRAIQKQISQLVENDKQSLMIQYKTLAPLLSIFGEWMRSNFRKVILRASDKEWEKLKEEEKDNNMAMVVDAGLTQIPAGSETVIGLFPIRKSQRSKTVQ